MSLITFLTRVHFADRVLEDALPEALQRLSAERHLLIVDSDAVEGAAVERLHDALPARSLLTEFPKLALPAPADRLSVGNTVFETAACDSIICLGGKTAMDFGRLLAGLRASAKAPHRPRPLIAIPTSIANVGLGPVHLGDGKASKQKALFGKAQNATLPAAILCDATLTMGASKSTLAAHGFKALTHCIEAFVATAYNPPADGIALEGIRRSAIYLERAVHENADLEAHRELLAVALNAGLAAQKGFGGAEALVRATEDEGLSVEADGHIYSAVMRPILAFNEPAVGERYDRIVEAMASPATAPVADCITSMAKRIGLPERLRRLQLDHNQIDSVARRAAANPANLTNPRHATHSDYRSFLREAM